MRRHIHETDAYSAPWGRTKTPRRKQRGATVAAAPQRAIPDAVGRLCTPQRQFQGEEHNTDLKARPMVHGGTEVGLKTGCKDTREVKSGLCGEEWLGAAPLVAAECAVGGCTGLRRTPAPRVSPPTDAAPVNACVGRRGGPERPPVHRAAAVSPFLRREGGQPPLHQRSCRGRHGPPAASARAPAVPLGVCTCAARAAAAEGAHTPPKPPHTGGKTRDKALTALPKSSAAAFAVVAGSGAPHPPYHRLLSSLTHQYSPKNSKMGPDSAEKAVEIAQVTRLTHLGEINLKHIGRRRGSMTRIGFLLKGAF